MAIAQPLSTDFLNSPDHSVLHRIIAADTDATVKSIQVSTTQTIISAPADSTTAIQFNKADLTTNVLNIDTTNGRVGIGMTGPGAKLEVKSGGVSKEIITAQASDGQDLFYLYENVNSDAMLYMYDTSGNNDILLHTAGSSYFNGGNVGIGTTGPTNLLSLGGNSARIFWMERHTTADTAGNTLTITAGGATAAATDKAGGDLILQGGLSTGSAESGVQIKGCVAGASGTADRTQTIAIQVLGNKIGFYAATPVAKQTGVAVTAEAIHAALVNLGLIAA